MDTYLEANDLVKYISSLSGFQLSSPGYPYNHMGATIVDTILQAGLNWRAVVKPRIDKVKTYTNAKTTSGFLAILEIVGVKTLLDWEDNEKPNRVLNLARVLISQNIETEYDLRLWLSDPKNESKLLQQRGIGNKTLDYIKMLSGLQSVAVDRHLMNFLKKAGIICTDYFQAHFIIRSTAKLLGVQEVILDHSIWKYMSGK